MGNPLIEVQKFGQSIWYDNIRRGLITSGELAQMVEKDGLLGVTSNPAIFTAAITGSPDYDQPLKALVGQGGGTAMDLYEKLAIQDIQLACDVLYPVYVRTNKIDGYVSFEVSPYLANDTDGTLKEARRLHKALGRENVLIKVTRHAGWRPRHQGPHQRRHQRQRHPAVLRRGLRGRRRGLPQRPRRIRQEARRPACHRQRGQLLHQPHRQPDRRQDRRPQRPARQHHRRQQARQAQEPRRQGGHRQRQGGLRQLQEALRFRPLEGPRRQERPAAAAALGQHLHQESEISEDLLRR